MTTSDLHHTVYNNKMNDNAENKYIKTFAENLRYLIGDMSISQFARKIGIPQQTISRYLLCQREISLGNLCKIADFFDEDIDYLLGRKS